MRFVSLLLTGCLGLLTLTSQISPPAPKPRVCLSFDDGSINDMPGYPQAEWNQLLLDNLKRTGKQAIFFVAGQGVDNPAGRQVLRAWDQAGHLLANHTYSHLYYHSDTVSYEQFAADFLRNHSLLRGYAHFTLMFRFPFLKEGNTLAKRDQFRALLASRGYRHGHVTIDASDWYVNGRLVKRLTENPKADVSAYQAFYLRHILDRATYYNRLGQELTGRPIAHTLLLHHNLASALFWALAKESGRYADQLRYPAEDGSYEEAEMNRLGL